MHSWPRNSVRRICLYKNEKACVWEEAEDPFLPRHDTTGSRPFRRKILNANDNSGSKGGIRANRRSGEFVGQKVEGAVLLQKGRGQPVTFRVMDDHTVFITLPGFPDAGAGNLSHRAAPFLYNGGFQVFRHRISTAADTG